MRGRRWGLGALGAVALAMLGLAVPAHARVPRAFIGIVQGEYSPYGGKTRGRRHEFARLHHLGVGSIRITIDPRISFATLDSFVLAAARHEMTVMPTLAETRRVGHGYIPAPRPGAMAAHAARLVRRYGPEGSLWRSHETLRPYAIRTWQIWNEPNLASYWWPRPRPAAYARLVTRVGRAIRRAAPDARIASAGLPNSYFSQPAPFTRYLGAFLKAGGGRYIDDVGLHGYSSSLGDFRHLIRSVRRVLRAHHERRLGILISEVGWADRGHPNRFMVGPKRQAHLISASYRLLGHIRRRDRIAGVYYFDWKDRPRPSAFSWHLHTGLLRANGRPKPALRAFRYAVRRLLR